jgi:hypothetical protein
MGLEVDQTREAKRFVRTAHFRWITRGILHTLKMRRRPCRFPSDRLEQRGHIKPRGKARM